MKKQDLPDLAILCVQKNTMRTTDQASMSCHTRSRIEHTPENCGCENEEFLSMEGCFSFGY